jgi:hypothetical protein
MWILEAKCKVFGKNLQKSVGKKKKLVSWYIPDTKLEMLPIFTKSIEEQIMLIILLLVKVLIFGISLTLI